MINSFHSVNYIADLVWRETFFEEEMRISRLIIMIGSNGLVFLIPIILLMSLPSMNTVTTANGFGNDYNTLGTLVLS